LLTWLSRKLVQLYWSCEHTGCAYVPTLTVGINRYSHPEWFAVWYMLLCISPVAEANFVTNLLINLTCFDRAGLNADKNEHFYAETAVWHRRLPPFWNDMSLSSPLFKKKFSVLRAVHPLISAQASATIGRQLPVCNCQVEFDIRVNITSTALRWPMYSHSACPCFLFVAEKGSRLSNFQRELKNFAPNSVLYVAGSPIKIPAQYHFNSAANRLDFKISKLDVLLDLNGAGPT